VIDGNPPHRAFAPEKARRIADLGHGHESAHEIRGCERRAAFAEGGIMIELIV
jgi:hypothetical protein